MCVSLRLLKKGDTYMSNRWRMMAVTPGKLSLEPVWVYDIETNGLDARKFVLGCAINVGTGERYHDLNAESFRQFLERKAEESPTETIICYGHNASKFDLLGLYNRDQLYDCEKVSSGTRVFEFRINGVKWRDTRHLTPVSLDGVAKSVGMRKGITPQEYIDGTVTDVSQEAIDYCYLDCEILVAFLNRLRLLYADLLQLPVHEVNLPLTAASMAYRIWCARFWPDEWVWTDAKKRERRMVSNARFFNESFRKAEHGGRVQVAKEPAAIHNNVISYDANALYPSVMYAEKFPDPKRMRGYSCSLNTLQSLIENPEKVCAANVHIVKPEDCIGMLPGSDESGRKDWTVGEYTGWMCEPELRLALEIGYEITEITELIGANAINPFEGYVRMMYDLRMEMREAGDPAHAMVKLLMCSLYGRYGIKEKPKRIEGSVGIMKAQESERWPHDFGLRFHDGARCEYPYLLDYGEMTRAPSSQFFGFSAFILSYGRERLMRAIMAAGDGFLYCDTDSVHFLEEYREQFEAKVLIGDDLGEWKLETPEAVFQAQYWEPKCYRHFDEQGNKILVKHKGVITKDEDGNYLPDAGDLTKVQKHRTIVGLYEALRRGLEVGMPIITEKRSARFFTQE